MQKIINEVKLDFDDVLIRPKRSILNSRAELNLARNFNFKYSPRELLCIPVMVANMDTVGTFDMAKSLSKHQAIICLHKHYKVNEYVAFYTDPSIINKNLSFYSVGTGHKDIEKLNEVFSQIKKFNFPLPNICIDVANGYSEKFVKTVASIRKLYEEVVIMAGNIVTQEMTEELLIHGKVDIVKVGIGSGSVCSTRLKTGVGYPQLSAVMECADAAHGLGGHICSDGGCKVIGDIAKAIGGGSDFVMLGSMFAGVDECEGEWEYEYMNENGFWEKLKKDQTPIDSRRLRKSNLTFYGMSSKNAMDKHHNGVAKYRTEEGKCVTIPYKGKAEEIIQDIYGGLRSACTYIGADKIKDFGKKKTFIQVNNTHNRIYE